MRLAARSEPLHPRAQFYLPGPSAVRLMDDVEIACSNRVRIEQARGLARRLRTPRALDAAVDHDVRHVDALRVKLARQALREPAQRELAHGEGRRLGVALHARRCA